MAEKPSVLIIGGLGYIGRFLALHIHENNLASEVRIVDKVLPQLAWLPPDFEEACAGPKFVQADASREREFCYEGSRPETHPRRDSSFCPLTRVFLCRRIPSQDIRPRRRENVGLCLQLRRRDSLLARG